MATNYAIVPKEEEAEKVREVEMKKPCYAGEGKRREGKSSTSAAGAPSHAAAGGGGRGRRDEWESGIFACTGKNDEFYSSDLEVCVLGCSAPCVLHGSNVERVGSKPGPATFATHCLPYTALCLLGNCFFGFNCLAPCFAYTNRTTIRRKFNLQGSCDAVAETIGCSENIKMNDDQHEHCESACDLATHIACHPCALCQEARELRRRLPHPGFTAKPVIVMLPPGGQTMAR